MTKEQKSSFTFLSNRCIGKIVEEPTIMHNETFGDVAYFTVKYGKDSFIEYGIKPNGAVFVVN